MVALHFIGSERIGGHRRYAAVLESVLREWGWRSETFDSIDGLTSRLRSLATLFGVTLVFHSFKGVREDDLSILRTLGPVRLIAFLHNPWGHPLLPLFDCVVPVSLYVREVLGNSGFDEKLPRISAPAYISMDRLLGFNQFDHQSDRPIVIKNSEYEWNSRKVRDVVLQTLEHLGLYPFDGSSRQANFQEVVRQPVVHIGVVSRLARLKKFPQLMSRVFDPKRIRGLKHDFYLHFIGAGPYRVVQDIKRNIPNNVRKRVFFWGWQPEAHHLMKNFDAILLGLPDKEALGLNALESTAMGVPVIGKDGGPFREVIEPGRNGWLLSDEQLENDFYSVLGDLCLIRQGQCEAPDFQMSDAFYDRFSEDRFQKVLSELFQ